VSDLVQILSFDFTVLWNNDCVFSHAGFRRGEGRGHGGISDPAQGPGGRSHPPAQRCQRRQGPPHKGELRPSALEPGARQRQRRPRQGPPAAAAVPRRPQAAAG